MPRQLVIREREHDPAVVDRLVAAGTLPVVARVLAARGISSADDLDTGLSDIPHLEGEALKAAELLAAAVMASKHICVVGDYDADGICATTLAKLALDILGARASWLLSQRDLPERSLDPSLVAAAAANGAEVLLTVDGGTSAHAGLAAARAHGMQVIVTDHHLPETAGPCAADALANPMLPNSGFAHGNICGTVVAMLVMRETFRLCASDRRVATLLDLAAVATIGDIMPLDEPFNRKVVMGGINLIRRGRCRNLFKVLLGHGAGKCNSMKLTFRVVPSLNAANRLGNPSDAVAGLLTDDIGAARQHASTLAALNRERKQLTATMAADAKDDIAAGEPPSGAIVAYRPGWHQGIVGIVANRLVDEYDMPAAVLCGPPGKISGSIRSVKGISVHQVLGAVEAAAPDLLARWGGHDMAAGLRLATDDVGRFRELFAQHAAAHAGPEARTLELWSDGELAADELDMATLVQLAEYPWGNCLPVPQFTGTFTLVDTMPSANGNGYNSTLRLGTKQLAGWSRMQLGTAGQQLRLLYSAEPGSRDPDRPFITPRHILPAA